MRMVRGRLCAVALAALALAGACGGDEEPRETAPPPKLDGPGQCVEDAKVDSDSRDHKTGVRYEVNPPSGGEHDPRAAAPGIYKRGQVPDGALVHSLEHGDIVVWHTTLDSSDEQKIHDLARRFPKVVLVMPRTGMDAPVAATAWHKRLLCQNVDVEALASWIEANKNKGPEVFPE